MVKVFNSFQQLYTHLASLFKVQLEWEPLIG
jgi:hypothetical protein